MGNCSTPKEKQQPKQQQQPVKKEVEAKSREIDFGAGGGAEKSLLQRAIEKEHGAARKLFHEMDGNGNGKLSLAEIDKAIDEKYPDYDHKPVLMRAMKLSDREGNHDGLLEAKEFTEFVEFLSLYTDLWKKFETVDKGHDRRISPAEFREMVPSLDMEISDPDAAFAEIDRDHGGQILFDEFCYWVAKKQGNSKIGSKDGLVGYQDTTGHHVGEGGAHHAEAKSREIDFSAAQPEAKSRDIDFGAGGGEKSLLQRAIEKEHGAARKLFHEMDGNGNGRLSLAEIDKAIDEKYPDYDHKPVLMRAMKLSDREGNHDGLLEAKEFIEFVEFLALYTDLWKKFETVDKGHDRRISPAEFREMVPSLNMDISDPDAAFAEIDRDHGGQILFDEFCYWVAKKQGNTKIGGEDGLVGYQDTTGHHVGEGGR
eukprot:Hpha_TRINITY_DN16206_c1_g3::TRINITY_DN16206_c1_g3_i6::g.15071::m.15071